MRLKRKENLTVLQISDCHLFADPLAEIRGVRTRETFQRVWEHATRFYPRADLLVISGDLTHDEREESYLALRDIVSHWLPRIRVIPGNHDDRTLLRATFNCQSVSGLDRAVFVEDVSGWRLIGLDSHVPGALSGHLGDKQLRWLNDVLREAESTPTLLFLHHPPILVNSPWLDQIGLEDAEAFQRVVAEHPQIRLICAGHVHQEFAGTFAGVPVLTAPSTGLQFRPGTEALEIDDESPGYRVLCLKRPDCWTTEVIRVYEQSTHQATRSVEKPKLLAEIMQLDGVDFNIAYYDYLTGNRKRKRVEEEAWLLLTMRLDIEMTGLIDLFYQLYTLKECAIVEARLRKLKLNRLADLFAEAKSIYINGKKNITEVKYQSINWPKWIDSTKRGRRFNEIGEKILAEGSEIHLINERVEKYVKKKYLKKRSQKS